MDEATIKALVDDDKNNEKIQNLIMCEPGVENMQKVLKEKAKSLRKMCSVNQGLKTELQSRLEIYEQAMAQLDSIEEENSVL